MPFLQEFGECLWGWLQQNSVVENSSSKENDGVSTLNIVIHHDKMIYLGRKLLKQLLHNGDFDYGNVPFVVAMYWGSIVLPAWNTVCRNVLHRHI